MHRSLATLHTPRPLPRASTLLTRISTFTSRGFLCSAVCAVPRCSVLHVIRNSLMSTFAPSKRQHSSHYNVHADGSPRVQDDDASFRHDHSHGGQPSPQALYALDVVKMRIGSGWTAVRTSLTLLQMHHSPEASIANTCSSQAWGACG